MCFKKRGLNDDGWILNYSFFLNSKNLRYKVKIKMLKTRKLIQQTEIRRQYDSGVGERVLCLIFRHLLKTENNKCRRTWRDDA